MNKDNLMKKALSSKYATKERAEAFHKIYSDYVKGRGNDKSWEEFRKSLRKKYSNELSKKQKAKFGLTKKFLIQSKKIITSYITKKSKFPVDLFYGASFSVIRKIIPKGAKILDIGYGDYPSFVNLLNKNGYYAFGIEPFPREFDKKKSFKATMKNIPKSLEQRYDLILINMVYSINYTHHFPKNFNWELKHKKDLIKKIALLTKPNGYLILVDDLGTIFSKGDLKKYFKIVLFEKDISESYGRLSILKKR